MTEKQGMIILLKNNDMWNTWYSIILEGSDLVYTVHHNKMKELRLKEGDKIKFQTTDRGPMGKDGKTYMLKLEKVEKVEKK